MSSASLAIRRSSKTAKAASTNKGGGKQKGVKNYKQDLVRFVVDKYLPTGKLEWEKCASEYQKLSGESTPRDPDSLKRYFMKVMCQDGKIPPTGKSDKSRATLAAQKIYSKILQKQQAVDMEDFGDADDDDNDDDEDADGGGIVHDEDDDEGDEDEGGALLDMEDENGDYDMEDEDDEDDGDDEDQPQRKPYPKKDNPKTSNSRPNKNGRGSAAKSIQDLVTTAKAAFKNGGGNNNNMMNMMMFMMMQQQHQMYQQMLRSSAPSSTRHPTPSNAPDFSSFPASTDGMQAAMNLLGMGMMHGGNSSSSSSSSGSSRNSSRSSDAFSQQL